MSFDPACRLPVWRMVVTLTAAMLLAVVAQANPITYQVNRVIGTGGVAGFIQTDGTMGVLSAANFIDWSLILSDGRSNFRLTGPLSGGNSSVFVRGTDVAAFDSFLFFNFSGIDYGVLMFERKLFSGLDYYCDSSQPHECPAGETVAATNGFQNAQGHGVEVIGTRGDPIPEPTTYALLGTGLALWALKQKL